MRKPEVKEPLTPEEINQARESYNSYMRKYRAEHKDQVADYNRRYWLKKSTKAEV